MDQYHAIKIDQQLQMMHAEMQKTPKLLEQFACKESCYIFRLPQSLVNINKEAYQPQIISIGPYHHGNEDLERIQEHKPRYLQGFLTRTSKPLAYFVDCIISMENEIRQSYSDSIEHICSASLAKMMLLDGVFLIELFRESGGLISTDDPILKIVWVRPFLTRDLLKIENQIPYFVLQKLFDESQTKTNDARTLPSLILEFFNYIVHRPKEVLQRYENLEGKHLLDFFRKSFMTNSVPSKGNEMPENPSIEPIQPATKLVTDGVKFKKNHEADSFLDIEFKNGVLSIPWINIDGFYTTFFLNGMAFEQWYSKYCSKDITTYVVFLGCLINTSIDVDLLLESKIIKIYYFGTELVKFFNNARKAAGFDIEDFYLKSVFKDVNEYCNNRWHVGWAGFKHNFFGRPLDVVFWACAVYMFLVLPALRMFLSRA